MAETANWRVSAAALLGVCAATGCALATVALAWPATPIAGGLGLASAFEARASRTAAKAPGRPDMTRIARAETTRSLNHAPANPTAWLRLAYLDSLQPRGLGKAGNRALAASYAVAPYGPDDTAWRLRFAFNHWSRIDRSNRLLVLSELRATPSPYSPVDLQASVTDPAGRLALSLENLRRPRETGPAPRI